MKQMLELFNKEEIREINDYMTDILRSCSTSISLTSLSHHIYINIQTPRAVWKKFHLRKILSKGTSTFTRERSRITASHRQSPYTHQHIHTGETSYDCSTHVSTHTPAHSHRREALSVLRHTHQLIHTGGKPYQCSEWEVFHTAV